MEIAQVAVVVFVAAFESFVVAAFVIAVVAVFEDVVAAVVDGPDIVVEAQHHEQMLHKQGQISY